MKKTLATKLCLAFLTAALCLTALAACDGGIKDKTVYYTVRFSLEGGQIAGKDVAGGISIKKGTELKLSDYIASKQGYTFVQWQRRDIVYAADATLKVEADMTLTACWQKITPSTYTVLFELNGGTMKDCSVTVTMGEALDLSLYIPVFTGYVFNGWRAVDGTLYKSNDAVEITRDTTLSAEWSLAETPKELFTFAPAGDGMSYILTGVTGHFKENTLAVPAVYGDKPVSRVAADALSGCDFIENFIAGENIVGLGAGLFKDCENLKSLTLPFLGTDRTITADMTGFENQLTALFERASSSAAAKEKHYTVRSIAVAGSRGWFFIPDSLTSITVTGGKLTGGAFADMKSLTSLTLISEEITDLPANACDGCVQLQRIDISQCVNLESVGDNAFRGCVELTSISFKNLTKLRTIGDGAFYGKYDTRDEKLTGISFEGCEALRSIGQMAFAYQDGLVALDFGDCASLSEFGRQIFDHCTKLTFVILPTGLKTLGSEAFRGCDALQNIAINTLNLWYTCEQGVLFDKDKTQVYKYPPASPATAFTAPASLKKIAIQAFKSAENLTVIDLSACILQEIGFQAFAGCVNARLTAAFDRYGYNKDGSEVVLSDDWAAGGEVVYAEDYLFFIFDIEGLTDGMKTDSPRLSFTAAARSGDADCQIEVRLNAALITGTEGAYTATLNEGENIIFIKASLGGKDETKVFKVVYEKKSAPTVMTTLEDGKVYGGDYLEFEIEAKDGAGRALTKSAVTIKTNWGYGLNVLTSMALEMTDVNGKILVKIDFATLWDMGFYEGGKFDLVVIAADGDSTAEAKYKIEHVLKAPAPTVTTTLEDGKVYGGDYLEFEIEAKDGAGRALTKSAVTIKTNWGYGLNDLNAATLEMTDVNGKIKVKINFALLWRTFTYEGGNYRMVVVVTDGDSAAQIEYTLAQEETR